MGRDYRLVEVEKDRSFLKRHKRWLSFSSSAVVLGTFIVNQMFRDRSKDLADSVDRARTAFVVRSEVQRLGMAVDELGESVDRVQTLLVRHMRGLPVHDAPSGERSSYWEALDQQRDWLSQRLPEYMSSFENMKELFLKLPYDQPLDDERWRLQRYMDAAQQFVHDEGMFTFLIRETTASKDQERARSLVRADDEKLIAAADKFPSRHNDVESTDHILASEALSDLGTAILDKATKSQEAAEKRAVVWKRISFILYPLGLLLGVLGEVKREDELA